MNLIKLIPVLFFLLTGVVHAKTYYLSCTDGDDNNNGLYPEKPWKTTSKMEWLEKNGGDVFLFKRGDDWTKEPRTWPLFLTGDKTRLIRYSSYGASSDYLPVLGRVSVGGNIKVDNLHIQSEKNVSAMTFDI